MLFRKLKNFSYILVMVLAMLQVVLPLIHAHPVDSTVNKVSGIHLHVKDTNIPDRETAPTINAQYYSVQVMGVLGGFEPEQHALPAVTLICLFIIVLSVFLLVSGLFPVSTTKFHARRTPRYFSLPLRAPPL